MITFFFFRALMLLSNFRWSQAIIMVDVGPRCWTFIMDPYSVISALL